LAADPILARSRRWWNDTRPTGQAGWPFPSAGRLFGLFTKCPQAGDRIRGLCDEKAARAVVGDRAHVASWATRLASRWLPPGVAGFDVGPSREGELKELNLNPSRPMLPGKRLRRFSARSENCPRAKSGRGAASRHPAKITRTDVVFACASGAGDRGLQHLHGLKGPRRPPNATASRGALRGDN